MRPYIAVPGHTDDFFAVREFLVRHNADQVHTPGFLWGRWEWNFALPYLDTTALGRIGVWERDGRIVGLVTYEQKPGEAWIVVDPPHRDLLPAMVDHAVERICVDGKVRILVPDDDAEMVRLVEQRGLVRSEWGEPNSVLDLSGDLGYELPEGFDVVSLADEWDVRKFHRLLHRGFGHPGEPDWSQSELDWRVRSTTSPGQRADLQLVTRAPDGSHVAFCGIWWWPGSPYAMVEPVCTDPDFRRMGCGRAAVLEGARRARDLGAQVAYVGSNQEFYYRIGFAPAPNGTWWVLDPEG